MINLIKEHARTYKTHSTHARHKASIHILQTPPRSLTLSNAFLRLRRKKALDGKKLEIKKEKELFLMQSEQKVKVLACKQSIILFALSDFANKKNEKELQWHP